MDYVKLGKRVKEARKRRGMTQTQLAELTEYSVQHISHVETGNTKLSAQLLVSIANALGVSIDELLSDSLEKSAWGDFTIPIRLESNKERDLLNHVVLELHRQLKDYK